MIQREKDDLSESKLFLIIGQRKNIDREIQML